jgi:hypothetical protein
MPSFPTVIDTIFSCFVITIGHFCTKIHDTFFCPILLFHSKGHSQQNCYKIFVHYCIPVDRVLFLKKSGKVCLNFITSNFFVIVKADAINIFVFPCVITLFTNIQQRTKNLVKVTNSVILICAYCTFVYKNFIMCCFNTNCKLAFYWSLLSVINCTMMYIYEYKLLFSPEKYSSAIFFKFFDEFKNKIKHCARVSIVYTRLDFCVQNWNIKRNLITEKNWGRYIHNSQRLTTRWILVVISLTLQRKKC